ncbi:MAG TPA: sigma-70 family RNA polymerase sigma factor [Urbifossiella sp.]|jgi:RNA polymerase sigma factor (sigma-70 family)|nr:sigma-70 family RNA polymerase sigma factor [Urbifossiella sp.]
MPREVPPYLAAHIRRMAAPGAEVTTDAELLGRYAEHRDAVAFEALVWRHGPMVWATCRRVLRHQYDVEDAFQAAFLALARTAGSIGARPAVAGWLHRVAANAALKLKAGRRTTGLTGDVPARPDPGDGELAGVVDEELDRLPARMRAAFVLCGLEGMTSAEAARELGCPVGTVESRLHTARARLRERLARRGFGPGVTAGLVLAAAPPAASVATAIGTGAGAPPRPAVDAIANQVSRIMTHGVVTMKAVTAAALAVVFTGAVWAGGGFDDAPAPGPKAEPPAIHVGPPPGNPGPALKAAPPVIPAGPPPAAPGHVWDAARPREPGGLLADRLGVYLTIEGIRMEGAKVEAGSLLVDTVNGKKLDKAVTIQVRGLAYPTLTPRSIDLPAKQRCVLKGYENGEMIGTPHALVTAAEEQGRTDVLPSQAVWRWRPYFVTLIAVEPKGLELPW